MTILRAQMPILPVLLDRESYQATLELQADFGENAGLAAADRADEALRAGDEARFARWRQIERMLVCLSIDRCFATVH